MVSTIIWLALGGGIFWWNNFMYPHQSPHYVGIRFTESIIGYPVGGQWLCGALALYCFIRMLIKRNQKRGNPGEA